MAKPSPWNRNGESARHTCVSAGMALQRDNQSYRTVTPILFQEHTTLPREAFIIPPSEMAKHIGAAGKEILAFFMTRSLAYVVYEDGEGCGYVYGRIDELLSPELSSAVRNRLGPD